MLRGPNDYKPLLIGENQVALVVKNPLPVQEIKKMRVLSLGQEDPLEEGVAIHASILA